MWDENWDAVMMFLRMQTQWQISMSGYVGLKYEVLLGTGGLCDLYNVEDHRDLLERLQIMETSIELRKTLMAPKIQIWSLSLILRTDSACNQSD